MRKIFITYRRTDAEYAAGALGRELRRHFGDDQIFRDKEDIGGGVAWKQQLLHEIDKDSALLVLIGRDWADLKDGQGRRRLDNPADGVRLEISDGIRDGAAIIPVLLENAQMPDERDLPPELSSLVEFNALKLRDGDWQPDVETICRTLERVGFKPLGSAGHPARVEDREPVPVPRRAVSLKAVIGGTLVLLAFAALGIGGLGRTDYLGIVAIYIVALVLGLLAWRETRNIQEVGRILGAVIATVAVFGVFAALRGYSGLQGRSGPDDRPQTQGGASDPASSPGTPPDTPLPLGGEVAPEANDLIALAAKAISGDLPSPQSILDRHVAAIGGRASLLRHHSRLAKGTLTTSGVGGALEWYTAKPNKVLVKVALPGLGDAIDGFDGTRGWRSSQLTGATLLTGKELEDERLESDFYRELTHESRYASMSTLEQTEFDGRPCFKLRLVRHTGEEEFELYDVETGLLAGSIKKYQSPVGRIARTTVVGEYRKFGDLLHPTTLKMQGALPQVITIRTIEYDHVPLSIFELPSALRAPVR